MKNYLTLIVFCLSTIGLSATGLSAIGLSAAEGSPLWLRRNSISPDGKTIAFCYRGDIYTVSSDGGKAIQLTSNPAYESNPIWTPDGKSIVFSSYREQSKDIFIISAEGGEPDRLTFHPGNETPLTTLADGRVLFSADIQTDAIYGDFPGNAQIYAVSTDGKRPVLVTSLPVAAMSVNNNGNVIYEDIKGYEDPFRKHHTSSVTRDIWLYQPATAEKGKKSDGIFRIDGSGTFTRLSQFIGEDRNPVFAADGDTFYYLSEKDGTSNIYKSSISSPQTQEQITFMKGNPVRYISVSETGLLSFSYDGELYTVKDGQEPAKVEISLVRDRIERESLKTSFSRGASDISVSPNGKEIAIVLRGDIYVTSVDYSTTKRITDTPQQERDVCFSEDGRTLYYSSERNGHWGIYETSLTDKKDKCFTYAVKTEEKRVTEEGQTCFQPSVSPDGKSIAFLRNRTEIVVRNIKSGKEKSVLPQNINYSYSDGDQSFAWSPDSRFILCNYQANGGWNNEDVALIEVETGEITDLTQSGYSDFNFKWALKGKAMTWETDKAGYRSHGSWGAESDIFIMFFDAKAYKEFQMDEEDEAIEELLTEEKKDDKKENSDSSKTEKKEQKLVPDIDNRFDRIIRLTNFSGIIADYHLTADGKKLYYMVRLENSMDLCCLDIKENSVNVVAKNVYGSIYPSKDDNYMFILSRGGISKISTASGTQEMISFSGDYNYRPSDEREYIFGHVWKQVDEKFYDPQIHGIDWEGYRESYKRFLPHIDNNFDFQELLSEMLGELNGSHTGARYFHYSGLSAASIGVLFDTDYQGDGLKIKEVLKGGAIACADNEIEEGDMILAIDGIEIKSGDNWYSLLEGKAGKRVLLNVKKAGKKAQEIFVTAEYSDYEYLYKRWVEQREKMVEELSGGKVGYVHVAGMDSRSFREVYSKLLGKYRTCEAVIVDTRHNGGGWLHDDLVTLLSGKAYIRFEPRGQYISTEPYSKWTKLSCVLIGEDNYSDASGFPYVYKTLGIGKLIGAPVPGTMTAVWWEQQIDPTIVFGIPQVGSVGIKEGRYLENLQVEPDILVYNDPASVLNGQDKQLEAAVAEMMKEIEAAE